MMESDKHEIKRFFIYDWSWYWRNTSISTNKEW